jgi:hypothetical protein
VSVFPGPRYLLVRLGNHLEVELMRSRQAFAQSLHLRNTMHGFALSTKQASHAHELKGWSCDVVFKQNDQLSWDNFEAITMKETNDLVRGVYWELDGLVLDVQESKQWENVIDVKVRTPGNGLVVTEGKTTDFNPNVDFCLFKGCITSRDVMDKHGYFAGTWSRVGQK